MEPDFVIKGEGAGWGGQGGCCFSDSDTRCSLDRMAPDVVDTLAPPTGKTAKCRDDRYVLLEYLGSHEVGWAKADGIVADDDFDGETPAPKKIKDRELHDAALVEATKMRERAEPMVRASLGQSLSYHREGVTESPELP